MASPSSVLTAACLLAMLVAPALPLPVKAPLPTQVAALLGWPQQDGYVPGAYQAE